MSKKKIMLDIGDLNLIKKSVENSLNKLEGMKYSCISKNQNIMNCEKNIKKHRKTLKKINNILKTVESQNVY